MLKNTWVGISLGAAGMNPGIDMIQIDGTGLAVFDKTSTGWSAPSTDAKNGLTGTATFTPVAGTNFLDVQIKRALDTGYSTNYVLETDKDITFGWAVRTTSPTTLEKKHDRAGSFVMRMNAPKTTDVVPTPVPNPKPLPTSPNMR